MTRTAATDTTVIERCPRCHHAVDPTELGNDRSVPAWWCDQCRLVVVLEEQAVRVPIERDRADLAMSGRMSTDVETSSTDRRQQAKERHPR